MKNLYIIRHAKSSWKFPELADSDRPLNKRGKRDAPEMGRRLKVRGAVPDLILSSPAKRAQKTAKIIAEAVGYPPKKVRFQNAIYHGGIDNILNVLTEMENHIECIFLVGHNPSLTYFANNLAGTEIDNIPTCGIVRVDFSVDTWRKITWGKGTFIFFDYPKKAKELIQPPE